MAEVKGIVTAALALLPLCREGLGLIRDIFDASSTLELAVGRVELQRERYDDWREIWRSEDGVKDLKFKSYAEGSPDSAKRILRQLALLSVALFDVRALETEYGFWQNERSSREAKDLSQFRGLELSIETQDSFLDRCKVNLGFMKKCKFVFRKKDVQWKSLTDILKEYIENLRSYGPEFELEQMLKAEFEFLADVEKSGLTRLADAAAYEARNSPPNIAKSYHNISLAASFSTVVKFERPHSVYKFNMTDFRMDPAYVISSSGSSTMALLFDYPVRKEHRVVLIEWIRDLGRDQYHDIRIKALMLAAPKPDQLLLPACYGMVEDPRMRRLGLVLAPPAHIRSHLPAILPSGAISQKRMPVSLKELLTKRHPSCTQTLELGLRFRLAKKLLQAVHMHHCVGWMHKSLHSESILFFAAPSQDPRKPGPSTNFPQAIGWNEPLFCGLSRAQANSVVDDPDDYYPDDNPGAITKRQIHINLDYYQHPDKRYDPTVKYSKAHDIYSLGCLLLEIGLWMPLDELVDVEDDDYDKTKREFQALSANLNAKVGSIYSNVVRRCLNISTATRTEAEVRRLSTFCSDIAACLDKCWA